MRMSNNIELDQQIDRYIKGQMSATELTEFETQLANDGELKKEVELQTAIAKAIYKKNMLNVVAGNQSNVLKYRFARKTIVQITTLAAAACFVAIGLITYYVVTKEEKVDVIKVPATNPNQEIVDTAKVIQDTTKVIKDTTKVIKDIPIDRIIKALNIGGEEFTLTDVDGVYENSTNDKMLIIKEDKWKKLIQKIQKRFPRIAKECNRQFEDPNLSEFKFVGLLSYLADSKYPEITIAYTAIEIRNGNAKAFSGGNVCCNCGGEHLVNQKVDSVIIK